MDLHHASTSSASRQVFSARDRQVMKRYLRIRKSPISGHGAFAKEKIRKGTIVGYYKGRLYSPKDYPDSWNLYTWSLGGKRSPVVILVEGPARFTNHPKIRPGVTLRTPTVKAFEEPNLDFVEAVRGGSPCVLLRATRTIQKGEELTVDYGPQYARLLLKKILKTKT